MGKQHYQQKIQKVSMIQDITMKYYKDFVEENADHSSMLQNYKNIFYK